MNLNNFDSFDVISNLLSAFEFELKDKFHSVL